MRPFDVSTSMFAVSACVVSGQKVPPELLKIIYEYIDKLEGSDGAGELVRAVDNMLKHRERIVAMSLPHGHMLTAELASTFYDLSTARNKVQQGEPKSP